jgi:protein-disulfide isomerase
MSIMLVLRALLAAVLATAAVGKLLDRAGTREAARALGAPEPLSGPIALALAPLELATAAGLLAGATAPWAALLALALLVVFSAAIARALARGAHPACRCFGDIGRAEIGPATLARNGALAALAAVIAIVTLRTDPATAPAWLVAVVVAVAVGVPLTARRLAGRRAASALGRPAPPFTLTAPDAGGPLTLDRLPRERPTLLVFVDPGCGACAELLPDVAAWQRRPGAPAIVLVGRGDVAANRAEAAAHGLSIAVQADGEVADAYGIAGTPSAVLIAPDRTLASPVAAGAAAIADLVAAVLGGDTAALAAPAPPPGPAVGAPLPALVLPALDGTPVAVGALDGRPTVLLALSPGCRFCDELVDDLRAWADAGDGTQPALLVLVPGTPEQVAALGLPGRAVLDERLRGSRLIGARSSPSALLVDGCGRVASGLARGAEATRLLIGLPPARAAQAAATVPR